MTNRKRLVTFVTKYLAHEWSGPEPLRLFGKAENFVA